MHPIYRAYCESFLVVEEELFSLKEIGEKERILFKHCRDYPKTTPTKLMDFIYTELASQDEKAAVVLLKQYYWLQKKINPFFSLTVLSFMAYNDKFGIFPRN